MRIREMRFAVIFVSLLLCASIWKGCQQIPVGEFNSYRDAFVAARTASESVLLEYGRTELAYKEMKERKETTQSKEKKADPFPKNFDPNGAIELKAKTAVGERLAAWDVISRYNDTLVALSEGQSADQLKGSFTALGNSMQSLATGLGASVPGFGAAMGIGSTILQVAEQARTKEEFVKTVRKGEPIILQILQVFQDDTANFYKLKRILADDRLADHKIVARKRAKEMYMIAKSHADPPTDSELAKSKGNIVKRLTEALIPFGYKDISSEKDDATGNPIFWRDLSGTSGAAAPYTVMVNSQLQQFLETLEMDVANRQSVVDEMNAFNSILNDYVVLVQAVKITLKAMREGVDKPVNLMASIEALLRTAMTVRKQIDAFRKQ